MAELAWGDGLQTWYQVMGEGSAPPAIICHGGPGATHDYVASIAALDRPCVLYDQVGNGRSSRGASSTRSWPSSAWTHTT